jgi:hypothetical protein
MSRSVRRATILIASSLTFVAIDAFAQDAAKDVQSQIDALKAALPKFAIPVKSVTASRTCISRPRAVTGRSPLTCPST